MERLTTREFARVRRATRAKDATAAHQTTTTTQRAPTALQANLATVTASVDLPTEPASATRAGRRPTALPASLRILVRRASIAWLGLRAAAGEAVPTRATVSAMETTRARAATSAGRSTLAPPARPALAIQTSALETASVLRASPEPEPAVATPGSRVPIVNIRTQLPAMGEVSPKRTARAFATFSLEVRGARAAPSTTTGRLPPVTSAWPRRPALATEPVPQPPHAFASRLSMGRTARAAPRITTTTRSASNARGRTPAPDTARVTSSERAFATRDSRASAAMSARRDTTGPTAQLAPDCRRAPFPCAATAPAMMAKQALACVHAETPG